MTNDKHIRIGSMNATLSKAAVKREGGKDEPKETIAYLTFTTVLSADTLEEFGLSDIARDIRFKPNEEIVLSELRQGYQGSIDLTVSLIAPVTAEAQVLVYSMATMKKMTLTKDVFGFQVAYLIDGDESWKKFGKIFQDYVGMEMDVTAQPDDRGKQEKFTDKVINGVLDVAPTELGKTLKEGESLTISTKGRKPVTVKGKKAKPKPKKKVKK